MTTVVGRLRFLIAPLSVAALFIAGHFARGIDPAADFVDEPRNDAARPIEVELPAEFEAADDLRAAQQLAMGDDPARVNVSDVETMLILPGWGVAYFDDEIQFELTSYFQPAPQLQPRIELSVGVSAAAGSGNLFGSLQISSSTLASARVARATSDVVLGVEAKSRVTTDTANLIGKTPSVQGVGVQKRNPVVTDPRVSGSRVGRLIASGSYWVPARLDLDTMLSKIDSRVIDNIVIVKGPFSALYGPDFNTVDVQLSRAPRYADGPEWHGNTSVDYKFNGRQVHGRQTILTGSQNWGTRFGYGHRTGNDYLAGDATSVPASYNSRDIDFAFGRDLDVESRIEFNYLRLDQTNMELPGQSFDIDYLVTDGFEVEYSAENLCYVDRMVIETWYNRTRFDGSAQRAGKRRQFPFYDFINFIGNTDVDSSSFGYRALFTWGDKDAGELTAGADLRYIRQELNEITSGQTGLLNFWNNANSPIPKSESINPGFFAQYERQLTDRFTWRAGMRFDLTKTNMIDDAAKLAALGARRFQSTFAEIMGTNEFDQNFTSWNVHLVGDFQLNDCWTTSFGSAYAQRPPVMTELYAAEPFMFVLQNGLNSVTGDPLLDQEQMVQLNWTLRYDNGRLRAQARAHHSWIHDYITFENLDVFPHPVTGDIEQVNLRYVNTNLATLTGIDFSAEYDWTDSLTPFGTLSYLQGQDQTRNGAFATQQTTPGNPTTKVFGLPRGFFSGVPGAASEPLPGISPLESRIGIRVKEAGENHRWGWELAARIVGPQNRVAASLLETRSSGFTTWDLRGYWRDPSGWSWVAGVENFTDRNYREHLDFRAQNGIQLFQPGINFYAGIEKSY